MDNDIHMGLTSVSEYWTDTATSITRSQCQFVRCYGARLQAEVHFSFVTTKLSVKGSRT